MPHSNGTIDTSQLLKGVLDIAVLAVLADHDSYGYDVLRRLRDSGLDGVGDASVYGTLRRLYQAGALKSYVVPSDEGPHRKYYGLNDRGRRALDQSTETWGSLTRASINCSTGGAPHMPDSNQADDVARYAAAVRAALTPLPEAERESLLEDLESHLEEVASESGPALRERLGEPEDYAEELKSAYGAASVQANPKQSRLFRDRSMALIHGVFGTR